MKTPLTDDAHFSAVARKLGAFQEQNGYHRGLFENTPFLLKRMSEQPYGYMLKLRRIIPSTRPSRPAAPPSLAASAARKPQLEWHERLSFEYLNSGIRSESEGDYVFLWFHEPLKLSPEQFHELLSLYFADHQEDFPKSPAYCYECRESGSASLMQLSDSIATICGPCLEKKEAGISEENQRLNASDARFSLMVPLAILLGSVGWAAFWGLYEAIFLILHTDHVKIPFIATGLIFLILGYFLGWPIGRILHKSGITGFLPAAYMAVLAALAIAVIGQVMFAVAFVFGKTGSLDIQLVSHLVIPYAIGDSMNYVVLKLGSLMVLAGSIYEVSKPKVIKFRV